ncbi:MAG: hypothetical protein JJLCMIEE_00959 [Acidimicrobiales bacterium]|nr:MAG: dihydrodipicolinate synthase family protein [Actinomycetota bacterium]MBV6507901.1 hypothetical protein [Acidimicrobiales bacterium]RIK06881.1 MAG: dihydrodipicolinate synthase family protein [Acidobacteriota bacterium]
MSTGEPWERIRPRRRITGISATLLPFCAEGGIDWDSLAAHISRTAEVGLIPALNMDTGYGALLDAATRLRVVELARSLVGEFVAAAHVDDAPGDPLDLDAYRAAMADIASRGGTPVVFPSHGLRSLPEPEVVSFHAGLSEACDRFIAFELGPVFDARGRIYQLETFEGLIGVAECVGVKHSSLDRRQEWRRLELRDSSRPDFRVLTGNDLAIDMVMYGSDYLLGLSTFAPDAFALRDRWWEEGDDRFYQLNDLLQYLGAFAFREPVAGYRHDAARFLRLRGWVAGDNTHPASTPRPDSDDEVLARILDRLSAYVSS